MKVSAKTQSSHWLWLTLLVTVMLTIWTAFSDKKAEETQIELVQPSKDAGMDKDIRKQIKAEQNTKKLSLANEDGQATLIPWGKLKREDDSASARNIFEPHSWEVIAPKPKSGPPPPPMAPAAPFVYMGKVENSPKGTLVLLTANEKLYSVAKGEQIDPFWRLDGEDANSLQLTFLPLNLPQVLTKTQKAVTSVAAPGVATEMNN
jgi:hypothetical protein